MAKIHAVYFDADDTDLRAAVLRAAGYDVDECSSVSELAELLRAERGVELVCIAYAGDMRAEGALAIAERLSPAPIVLFRSADHHYLQHAWDLEFAPLTHPETWLAGISELMAERRVDGYKRQPEASGAHVEQLRRRVLIGRGSLAQKAGVFRPVPAWR